MIARAKEEGRALLEQVQEARKRLMTDLAGRRRALSIQIEQLRAARDEMAASIKGTRASVDEILARLDHTDDDARAAALAAGDQARLHLPKDVPHDQEAIDGGENGAGGESDQQREARGEATPGGMTPSVDELFARIRAASESGAPVEPVPAPGAAVDAGQGHVATAIVIEVDEEVESRGTGRGVDRPPGRSSLADLRRALESHQACAGG